MDREQAKAIFESAQDEYESAFREWRAQQGRMDGLKLIRSGVLKMYPDLAAEGAADSDPVLDIGDDSPTKPKGAEAVGQIMKETAGKWFTVATLVKELDRRSWLPVGSDNPTNATRAALERLVASDSSYRKDTGAKSHQVVYSYKGTPESSAETVMTGDIPE